MVTIILKSYCTSSQTTQLKNKRYRFVPLSPQTLREKSWLIFTSLENIAESSEGVATRY